MSEHHGESERHNRVHNRLDKVVLAVTQHDAGSARTTLTAAAARQIAFALQDAADAAERTPGR